MIRDDENDFKDACEEYIETLADAKKNLGLFRDQDSSFDEDLKYSNVKLKEEVMYLMALFKEKNRYKTFYDDIINGLGWHMVSVSNEEEKKKRVADFKLKFETKNNEYRILIVNLPSNKQWTLVGFDDNGEFKNNIISDSGLLKELKKDPANEGEIFKLAILKLGRTFKYLDKKNPAPTDPGTESIQPEEQGET